MQHEQLTTGAGGDSGAAAWFHDHFVQAPEQIAEFLEGDGIEVAGRVVADVGCGDGLIDLGIIDRSHPARLVGFDVEPTSTDELRSWARRFRGTTDLPAGLEFRHSTRTRLPAEDAEFDLVVSWSAFEHIAEPVIMAREIRRILKPHGVVFIQVWPLYYSEHGAHVWPWFPDGFAQFRHDPAAIEERVRTTRVADEVSAQRLRGAELNRMTVDELQRSLLAGGLNITKVELLTQSVHIPPKLARFPISWTAITGIKLLACPDPHLL